MAGSPGSPQLPGYINTYRERVRTDNVSDPTQITSRIKILQPSGGVFDVTNHEDNQVYLNGDPVSVAEFSVYAAIQTGARNGFRDHYVGLDGTAYAAEMAVDMII